MRALIAGPAGFICSNSVRFLLSEHADVTVVAMDSLTYAGNLDNLAGIESD